MLDHARQIRKLALDMRDRTSRNDRDRPKLQRIADLADELLTHFTDDGR